MRRTPIFDAFYRAYAREFVALERAMGEVLLAKTIETAEGAQLDKLASIVFLERRTGETDSEFRVRIRSTFQSYLASGTLEDLDTAISQLLDADDGYSIQQVGTATIEVAIQSELLEEQDLELEQFFDEVEAVTAGGVSIIAVERGTFRHTDELEPVESDRGYAELDPEAEDGEATLDDVIEGTGGTWSTIR